MHEKESVAAWSRSFLRYLEVPPTCSQLCSPGVPSILRMILAAPYLCRWIHASTSPLTAEPEDARPFDTTKQTPSMND